jgi:hypothetical protein
MPMMDSRGRAAPALWRLNFVLDVDTIYPSRHGVKTPFREYGAVVAAEAAEGVAVVEVLHQRHCQVKMYVETLSGSPC